MSIRTLAALPSKSFTLNLLIFKTNIAYKNQVNKIGKVLDADSNIIRWNLDRQDIDKVLRIEAINLGTKEIIDLVKNAGYLCEELPG